MSPPRAGLTRARGCVEIDLSIDGSERGTATAIAVGKNGHVYVGGYFDGKVAFSNPYHFISQGGHDAFVLELDQNGNTLAAVVGAAMVRALTSPL